MTTTMTVKGQVTIPKEVREAAGMKAGDKITARATASGTVVLERAGANDDYKERLYAIGRLGLIKDGKSTDEFMLEMRGDPDEDPGFNPKLQSE